MGGEECNLQSLMSKITTMENGKMVCIMEMAYFIGKMVNITLGDMYLERNKDSENLNFIPGVNMKEIGRVGNNKELGLYSIAMGLLLNKESGSKEPLLVLIDFTVK